MKQTFAKFVDRITGSAHKLAGLLCLALIAVTTQQVIARYFFQASSIALQELQWHLYGAIFLLGSAWTLRKDGHVRVDILYNRLPDRKKRIIETIGTICFLGPMVVILMITGWQFMAASWEFPTQAPNDALRPIYELLLRGEASPDPGGLPGRWILKSLIPFGALLILLEGLRRLVCRDLLPKGDKTT